MFLKHLSNNNRSSSINFDISCLIVTQCAITVGSFPYQPKATFGRYGTQRRDMAGDIKID